MEISEGVNGVVLPLRINIINAGSACFIVIFLTTRFCDCRDCCAEQNEESNKKAAKNMYFIMILYKLGCVDSLF